jgi:hypothetical protein
MLMLLFAPAWTTRYWQAWIYRSIFIGASAPTLWLLRSHPALLERRVIAASLQATRVGGSRPRHLRAKQRNLHPVARL